MSNCIDRFQNEHDIQTYLDESDDNIIICYEFDNGKLEYHCQSRYNLLNYIEMLDPDLPGGNNYTDFPFKDEILYNLDDQKINYDEIPEIQRGEYFDKEMLVAKIFGVYIFWKEGELRNFANFLRGGSPFCKLFIEMELDIYHPVTNFHTYYDLMYGDDNETILDESSSEDELNIEDNSEDDKMSVEYDRMKNAWMSDIWTASIAANVVSVEEYSYEEYKNMT